MRQHVIALVLAAALAPSADGQYHVTHTYTLGGDGAWDYVIPDPPSHRLYIARRNRLMVVDENDGKLLGEVTAGAAGFVPAW